MGTMSNDSMIIPRRHFCSISYDDPCLSDVDQRCNYIYKASAASDTYPPGTSINIRFWSMSFKTLMYSSEGRSGHANELRHIAAASVGGAISVILTITYIYIVYGPKYRSPQA